MTLQNIQTENKSVHAVSDSSKSQQDTGVRDARVAVEPVTTNSTYLDKYCATNPGAAQCRIYDV